MPMRDTFDLVPENDFESAIIAYEGTKSWAHVALEESMINLEPKDTISDITVLATP